MEACDARIDQFSRDELSRDERTSVRTTVSIQVKVRRPEC